jgi:hypothetical protein
MVIITIDYQALYDTITIIIDIKMVDNKSKDESSSVRSSDTSHVFDTVNENFVRAVNEVAKVQPQYSQSVSNIQLDYIQTAKNMIQNTISAQKQWVSSWNIIQVPTPYTEQFAKQSNEIANNILRAFGINNQLAINALDVVRDNLKIYNRTVDTVTEFNNNIAKACTSFFSAAEQQQQQFFKQ